MEIASRGLGLGLFDEVKRGKNIRKWHRSDMGWVEVERNGAFPITGCANNEVRGDMSPPLPKSPSLRISRISSEPSRISWEPSAPWLKDSALHCSIINALKASCGQTRVNNFKKEGFGTTTPSIEIHIHYKRALFNNLQDPLS
jgi:hypothetical protein